MCSDIVVRVDNLGKCYQIYKKPHERLLQSIFRGKKTFYKDFWALRNISFHVKSGETVGIVGRNGSGKTTLLQLVCGTLLSTEGTCNVSGRVAALLALGAGFNPEYSGEENIHLYASLLGLSGQEIEERFNSICEFADIGEFISQPVKKYSSGMYMRLAFSVAIHVEPEILIVDEALAVGDEAFQRKCYAKLEELKKAGLALLFVSHSAGSVINLCDRALLLEKGSLLASGPPKAIISAYHKLLFSPASKVESVIQDILQSQDLDASMEAADSHEKKKGTTGTKAYYVEGMQSKSAIYYEMNGAEISEPCMTTPEGKRVNVLCKGETYNYTYKVTFKQDCQRVRFGMLIKTITGIEIGGFATSSIQNPIDWIQNGSQYSVKFTLVCRLNPGVYFFNAGVKAVEESTETYLHRIIDAVMIRVMPEEQQQSTGIVDFELDTHLQPL
jgi:lipopolysaccharide transport system ATP-binding protein